MNTTIPATIKDQFFSQLREANLAFQKLYPGDRTERQPVHTVYGGANLFKYNSAKILSERAIETFQLYAPDFITFGRIFGLNGMKKLNTTDTYERIKNAYEALPQEEKKRQPAWLSYEVYQKVFKKLQTEAIEDFRIDFEDGYGNRPNEE